AVAMATRATQPDDAARMTLAECNELLLSIEQQQQSDSSDSALRLLRAARSMAALCGEFRSQLVVDDTLAERFLAAVVQSAERCPAQQPDASVTASVAIQTVYNACAFDSLDSVERSSGSRLAGHVTDWLSSLCRLVLSLQQRDRDRPAACLSLLLVLLSSSRSGSQCLAANPAAEEQAAVFVRQELLTVCGVEEDSGSCAGDRLLALRELLGTDCGSRLLMPELRLSEMQPAPAAQDCLAQLLHLAVQSQPEPPPLSRAAWRRLLEHLRSYASQLLCTVRADPVSLESGSALFFCACDLLGRPLANWQAGQTHDDDDDDDVASSLRRDLGLARLACQLLRCADLAGRANPAGPFAVDRRRLLSSSSQSDADPVYEAALSHPGAALKTALVRFLANAAYSNPPFQLAIVKEGGLPELLNCLALDDKNPCLRQWAALAIRNLCQDCPEARDLLRRLRPLGDGADNLSSDSRGLLDECCGTRQITVRNGRVVPVDED
ncbi:hypothetical protein BOX15_Mlig008640g3, partial [Macrostomum lignano]